MDNKVLYREVKCYDDAYRFNSENDASRAIGTTKFICSDSNDKNEVQVISMNTNCEKESILNKVSNGIFKGLKFIVEIIIDIVTELI